MRRSKAQMERLIRGAMGEINADLVVTGGRIVNVYSGENLSGMEIAVLDGIVCYVGPSADHVRGERTEILDAEGLYVSPGFIDAHTHIGHFCRPYEYLEAYLPHGTTSLVTSCDEHSTVFGFQGVKLFLDEVETHSIRVYALISMVAPQDPLLCNTRSLSQAEVAEGLADPRVLGLGEIVSWPRLLQGDREFLERIEMALRHGKIIHGHTAGARDRKLSAIAAASVSSCHEPISEEEAVERLRLGYWLMLREGTFRRDLEATLRPIVARGLSTQRLILVTDGMAPDDVDEDGHIDFVVRRAIGLGLPPVQAIQAVTLNPATYSGLEQEIGGIAPGRYADFTLLEDLEKVRVNATIIGGRLVAKGRRPLVRGRPISFPGNTIKVLRLEPTVSPDAFRITCPSSPVKIRVMELINLTITREAILQVSPRDGAVDADLGQDLLKVAVFDRHGASGRIALGFLKGFGARVGAVGTTVNLDEYALVIAGSNDKDMAVCANVLIEEGGGFAVVDQEMVVEKVSFPVGGVFSLEPWQEVGKGLRRLHRCLRERGSPFSKPIYPICFLTFVALPALRITDRGLVRVKDRSFVPLFVED
ncbi:MAG: adenine deaminase C-terminal domain-containing protein [Candidatus Binatia bacterium]